MSVIAPQSQHRAASMVEERPCDVGAARRRTDDREIDRVVIRVAQELDRRRTRREHDLHAEALLILEGNQPREPFAGLRLDRLMDLGQPVRAHLRRPAGRQWILDGIDHVQPCRQGFGQLPCEGNRRIEGSVAAAVQQNLSHLSASDHGDPELLVASAFRLRRGFCGPP
jgi:hypothetical protein